MTDTPKTDAAVSTSLIPMIVVLVFAVGITLVEVVFAVQYFQKMAQSKPPTPDELGSYLGGVASAIGFVWILAGFLFQWRELSMQRQELSIQRLAIERSANAAQIEIALVLRELYAKKLGESARQIAIALFPEDGRATVEPLYVAGADQAYIHWLLSQPTLKTALNRAIGGRDLLTTALIERYATYDQEYLDMVAKAEVGFSVVSQTLQMDAPSQLARAFRQALPTK